MERTEANIVTMGGGGQPAYVISVDNIDLNMVPLWRVKSREDTIPLWSASASGPGAEYFEFQVLASEVTDRDDAENENASSEPCHVCDVTVPSVHRASHVRGERHGACAAIARTGMNRTSQQILLDFPTTQTGQSAYTYYCDNCCVAVDLSKHGEHEQTEKHSESVLYTKLMKNLASLYANKNNLKDVCKEIFGVSIFGIKSVDKNTTDINVNQKEFTSDSNAETKDSENIKYPGHGTQIVLNPKSGAKLNVLFDNYHGFHTVDGRTQCRVCQVMVDSKDTHYLDAEHVKRVETVLEDKHCIRKLNQILNHCILCNDIIESIEFHIQCSDQHSKSLKEALISDDKTQKGEDSYTKEILADNYIQTVALNDQSYYCNVCKVYILKSTLFDHVNVEAHKKILQSVRLRIKKGSASTKKSDTSYCTLCNVYLPKKGKKAEKLHLRSEDHRYNERLSEKDNKIHHHKQKFANLREVQCQFGEEKLTDRVEKVQDNAAHKSANTNTVEKEQLFKENPADKTTFQPPTFKLLKPKKKLHYLFEIANSDEEHKVTCLVCKINLPIDAVMIHRKDRKHKDHYLSLMVSNTMFRIRHRCFCECCREIMKVNDEYVHLTSDRHLSNLAKNTVRMDAYRLKELSLRMFNEDIAAEKAIKRMERYTRISKTDLDEDSDDSGEFRFNNLKTLLFLNSSNDLSKDSENENSVSDSFVSAISNGSEMSQTSNPETKLNENNELKTEMDTTKFADDLLLGTSSLATTNDVDEEDSVFEANHSEHNSDDELKTALDFTKSVAHLFEETNTHEILCKLCHFILENRSDVILEHTEGVKHTKRYDAVLLQNDLKELVDNTTDTVKNYNCKACGIDVKKSELFLHINSNKHKLYLNTQPSTSRGSQKSEDKKDISLNNQKNHVSNTLSNPVFVLNENDRITLSHKYYLMEKFCDNQLYCKICDAEILDVCVHMHVHNPIHLLKFESILIENEVKKVGIQMFCGLCKIGLTEGTELEHIYGDKHTQNLDCALPTNKKLSTVKANKGYICTICNIEILNKPNVITFHNKSVRHKNNLLASKNKNVNRQIETNTLSKLDRISPTSNVNTSYFCKLCRVNVPNNHNNIKSHNEGGPHKNKLAVKSKLATPVPLAKHLGSKPNLITSVTKTVEIPQVKPKATAAAVAAVKQQKIKNSPHEPLPAETEFNKKIKSSNTKPSVTDLSNVQSKLIIPGKVFNNVINGFCHVCKAKVSQNDEHIKQHVNGRTHIQNLQMLINKQIENKPKILRNKSSSSKDISCDTIAGRLTNNNPNITGSAADSYLTTSNIYIQGGFCNLCETKVSNDITCIKEHIKGKSHVKKLQLLKSNTSENLPQQKKVDKNNYQNPPNLINTRQTANDSILTVKEKTYETEINVSNLSNTESARYPTILPPANHNTSDNNAKTCNNGKGHFNNDYVCNICKLKVPNNPNNINEHLKGTRHLMNLKKAQMEHDEDSLTDCKLGNLNTKIITSELNSILKSNDIIEHDGNIKEISKKALDENKNVDVTCDDKMKTNACDNGKTRNDDSDAFNSNVEFNNVYVCDICKIKVPNNPNNINEHLKGTRHLKNTKKAESEHDEASVTDCKLDNLNSKIISSELDSIHKSTDIKEHYKNNKETSKKAFNKNESKDVTCGDKKKTNPCDNSKTRVDDSYFSHCSKIDDANSSTDKDNDTSDHANLDDYIVIGVSEDVTAQDMPNTRDKTVVSDVSKSDDAYSGTDKDTDTSEPRKTDLANIDHYKVIRISEDVTTQDMPNTRDKTVVSDVSKSDDAYSGTDKDTDTSEPRKTDLANIDHYKVIRIAEDVTTQDMPNTPDETVVSDASKSAGANSATDKDTDTSDSRKTDHDVNIDVITDDVTTQNMPETSNQTVVLHASSATDKDTNTSDSRKTDQANIDNYKVIGIYDDFTTLDMPDKIDNATTRKTNIDVDNSTNCTKIDKVSATDQENSTSENGETENTGTCVCDTSKSDFNNTSTNVEIGICGAGTGDDDDEDADGEGGDSEDADGEDAYGDAAIGEDSDGEDADGEDDSKSETSNDTAINEDKGFYICKFCEKNIPNNQIDIKSHVKSYFHVTNIDDRKIKENEGLLPVTKKHYCDICKIEILNNSIDIKKHNSSEKHKMRFEKILTENRITIRNDKICFCEPCDLYFSKFTASAHIARMTHALKLG